MVRRSDISATASKVPRSLKKTSRHGCSGVPETSADRGGHRGIHALTWRAYSSYVVRYLLRMKPASHRALARYCTKNTIHATGSIQSSRDQTAKPVHNNQFPTYKGLRTIA